MQLRNIKKKEIASQTSKKDANLQLFLNSDAHHLLMIICIVTMLHNYDFA